MKKRPDLICDALQVCTPYNAVQDVFKTDNIHLVQVTLQEENAAEIITKLL